MTDAQSTLMFAEAASAASVLEEQRRRNRAVVSQLGERLRATRPTAVLTCARGSSDHAATFARYLIETRAGVLTSSQAPSIASVYDSQPQTGRSLCIAISQSGKSPDILAAASAARQSGAHLLALVNVEDSPLAQLADTVLPLCAGKETSVAATKSYIAALAAIVDLVAEWTEDQVLAEALEQAPDLLRRSWEADWSPLSAGLNDVSGLFVIGRGPGLGIAQEAALKFKETCGIHAEAFSAAEVLHGPIALAGPDFPLLVFRQSDESAESIDSLVREVASRGGKLFVAGPTVDGAVHLPVQQAHAAIEPMLQIQSFYRAVNALALARGFNPDQPRNLRKVTETV
ncbi:SIS domain-containing protein [Sphingomonas piscis]|uniref:SIS domain-containing protein n=1 Tax=Sphingomonas piscis TaxID=2714943 RepID=A0A6G7YPD1_9SPHN|nr:SIS domain-containing protein [Sphingomonas piscis]QIK78586.1 SIS domain-containing protein [Sphingomonas piscis]